MMEEISKDTRELPSTRIFPLLYDVEPVYNTVTRINDDTGQEETFTQARVSTTSLHFHSHNYNQYNAFAVVSPSLATSESLPADVVIETRAQTLVSISKVLRTAGFMIIVFVGFCIIGNATSTSVILHPYVALVCACFGGTMLLMSFAREPQAGTGVALVKQ